LTEVAPGIDLDKDIRAQIDFEVRVAGTVKTMDPALFQEF
jgi:acyl CoA:acetate/3-ketoacid CoA transferase